MSTYNRQQSRLGFLIGIHLPSLNTLSTMSHNIFTFFSISGPRDAIYGDRNREVPIRR